MKEAINNMICHRMDNMFCQKVECPFIKGPRDADACVHYGNDGKCGAPDEWEMNCARILSNLYTDTIHEVSIMISAMLDDFDSGEKLEVQKIVMRKSEFEALPEYDP